MPPPSQDVSCAQLHSCINAGITLLALQVFVSMGQHGPHKINDCQNTVPKCSMADSLLSHSNSVVSSQQHLPFLRNRQPTSDMILRSEKSLLMMHKDIHSPSSDICHRTRTY